MKKHKRFYCIECLRKFRIRDLRDGNCPHCNVPARGNTTRIVAQIVTRLLRHRGLAPQARKTDYQIYLESDLWKHIRARVLARDGGICRMCGSTAQTVHHESYDREVLDGRRDDKLHSLCKLCHSDIEFTTTDEGGRQKNGLDKANHKMFAAIKARQRK